MGSGRFTVPLSEDGSKPNAVLQHFFDGLAILHKFRMSNGQVYYSSRHTAEGVVRKAARDGFLTTTMFGLNANTPLIDAQDPCSALLGAQVSIPGAYSGFGITVTDLYSNPCISPKDTFSQTRSTLMLFRGGECIFLIARTLMIEEHQLRPLRSRK